MLPLRCVSPCFLEIHRTDGTYVDCHFFVLTFFLGVFFNERGGLLYLCRKSLWTNLLEEDNYIRIHQKFCCRDCGGDGESAVLHCIYSRHFQTICSFDWMFWDVFDSQFHLLYQHVVRTKSCTVSTTVRSAYIHHYLQMFCSACTFSQVVPFKEQIYQNLQVLKKYLPVVFPWSPSSNSFWVVKKKNNWFICCPLVQDDL